jgi:hypothetical protein
MDNPTSRLRHTVNRINSLLQFIQENEHTETSAKEQLFFLKAVFYSVLNASKTDVLFKSDFELAYSFKKKSTTIAIAPSLEHYTNFTLIKKAYLL